jgi:predicted permease
VRQLLTESVVLGLVAAVASVGLGQLLIAAAVEVMYATLPADIAALIHTVPLRVDLRVVGFMLVAGLVASMLFGVAPALQSTRAGVALLVQGELTRGVPAARLRTLLAAGQVTLCVVLVTCAGILLRSAAAITRIDLGFKTAHVLLLRIDARARPAALRTLASHPEVTHVAAARSTPMNGLLPSVDLSTEDGRTALRSWYNGVSPGFFDLLHVPLVEGRPFSEDEARRGGGVAILSAAAARQLWPTEPAIGRMVQVRRDAAGRPVDRPPVETLQVIGVARDIVSCCVTWGKDPAVVYVPVTPATADTSLVFGVSGDVAQAQRDVEATLDRVAPGAIDEIRPLDQSVAGGVYPFRAASWIIAALAALALALTVSGIYGVLSYVVSQRTKELGIRMAVGATTAAIARLVIGQALHVSAYGVAAGGALVTGLGFVIGLRVPFLDLLDVPVYAASLATVLVTALVAAALPAWRAMRVDPVASLRRE